MKKVTFLFLILILLSCTSCKKSVENISSTNDKNVFDSETAIIQSETQESNISSSIENENSTSQSISKTESDSKESSTENNSVTSMYSESKSEKINNSKNNTSSAINNYKSINYTVTYDANGGWGTTTSSSHRYNEKRALSANGFKNAGFEFIGWNTVPESKSALYQNKQQVENLTTIDKSNIILYAIWKECPTANFDDCMPTSRSNQTALYHTTATDNQGNIHKDATVVSGSRLNGKIYRSDERYVNGRFSTIKGKVFLMDGEELDSSTQVRLVIEADGQEVYRSEIFTQYSGPQSFQVDISSANSIYIRVGVPGNSLINIGAEMIIDNLTLVR